MSHTNTTPNYNLPQFVGSDKPAWLTDINNAMSAIDTAIAAAKAAADNAGGAAASLATTVAGHTTQLETLSNTVTNQGASIVSQGNAINTISELIGNGTPTTTDHTLIGAINELNAKEGDLADLTTTDKSSLVAAINEVAQSGGGGSTGEHVEVVGDGSDTYSQKLDALAALVDMTKVNRKTQLVVDRGNGLNVYQLASTDATQLRFTSFELSTANSMAVKTTGSSSYTTNTIGGTSQDYSSSPLESGRKITIYY